MFQYTPAILRIWLAEQNTEISSPNSVSALLISCTAVRFKNIILIETDMIHGSNTSELLHIKWIKDIHVINTCACKSFIKIIIYANNTLFNHITIISVDIVPHYLILYYRGFTRDI